MNSAPERSCRTCRYHDQPGCQLAQAYWKLGYTPDELPRVLGITTGPPATFLRCTTLYIRSGHPRLILFGAHNCPQYEPCPPSAEDCDADHL